jgi:hypothetical protein
MNALQPQAIAIRVASLLASLVVTALIVGGQFGIADAYARQADAVLAAKIAQQPVAQQAVPAPQPRS